MVAGKWTAPFRRSFLYLAGGVSLLFCKTVTQIVVATAPPRDLAVTLTPEEIPIYACYFLNETIETVKIDSAETNSLIKSEIESHALHPASTLGPHTVEGLLGLQSSNLLRLENSRGIEQHAEKECCDLQDRKASGVVEDLWSGKSDS